jgi:hypothetical protein
LKLLELRPWDANGFASIGNILFHQGETGRAPGYFVKVLENDLYMTGTLAHTAWILATTPDGTLRDAACFARHGNLKT